MREEWVKDLEGSLMTKQSVLDVAKNMGVVEEKKTQTTE